MKSAATAEASLRRDTMLTSIVASASFTGSTATPLAGVGPGLRDAVAQIQPFARGHQHHAGVVERARRSASACVFGVIPLRA